MAEWRTNSRATNYVSSIDAASTTHGLPNNLLGSLIERESQFDPEAVSPAGARGIAQIVPTAHPTAKPDDAEDSIKYAAGYLNRLHGQFGSWDLALAAYNWGQGNVRKAQRKHGSKWLEHAPEETRNYVAALYPVAQQATNQGTSILPIPERLLATPRDPLLDDEEIGPAFTPEEIEKRVEARYKTDEFDRQREIDVAKTEIELQDRAPAPRELSALDYAEDIAAGINRAPLAAYDEVLHFAGDIAGWVGLDALDKLLQQSDTASFVADATGVGERVNETVAGDLSHGIAKFLVPFGALNKAAKVAKGGVALTTAENALVGAVVDIAAFDPHEARLADLVEEYPALSNPVTAYLSADESDSEAEGRFKNAIEGLGIGATVDGLLRGLRYIRSGRKAKAVTKQADEMVKPRELADVQKTDANINNVQAKEVNADDYLPAKAADDAENAVAKSADDAENAPAVTAKSYFSEEQFRSHLHVNPKLRDELAERIARGDLNAAEDLIDFNAQTVDWSKLEDPSQVKDLINTTSDVLADFIDETKGGVQSLAQTRKLAALVGGSAEQVSKLFADVRGSHGITARMFAAQKVLTASADKLRELAAAAAKDGATKADEMAFLRQVELHGMVQAQIKGAQTEIARALHAMRGLKAASADSFREFDDIIVGIGGGDPARRKLLANKIAKLRDEAGVNKIVRRSRFQKAGSVAMEIYINGLLSAISTQTLNNVSNLLKVIEGGLENYVAAGIGKLRTARVGSNAERIALQEANSRFFGTMLGFRRATGIGWEHLRRGNLKEIGKALKESPTARALIEEKPVLDVRQRVDADTRKAIAAVGDGLDAKAINALGKVIRLPGRMIMTSDEFFKNINYQQELSGLAYRKAAEAADARGLTGAKRAKAMEKDIMAILNDPPDDLHFAALDHARYQTFQSDLGQYGKAFEQLMHKVPAMRVIVPFFRTPVNIVKQAVTERSPFALATKTFWSTVSKGGPEADLALARLASGTTLMGAAAMAAFNGTVTGSGKNNGARRNTEALDGIPPYSIKIGDTWYQYNRLEPFGLITGLSADLVEIGAAWGNEEMNEANEIVFGALTAIMTNITDKTWFKGVADAVQALEDPKRYATNYSQNLATAAMPYSSFMRRMTGDIDPVAREAWTLMDKLKSKLPGLSDDLPARRDLLGNEVIRQDYLGPTLMSPFAVGKEKDDPVYSELARLEMYYDRPERDVFGTGEDVSAEVYSEFLRIRGQERMGGRDMQEALDYLFNSSTYQDRLSDEGRRDQVKNLISKFTTAARNKMIVDDPELLKKVRTAKVQDLRDRLQQP